MVTYKQKCARCKTNWALVRGRSRFPVCIACEMKAVDKPIKDKTFAKMFDIPRAWYEQNHFLRSIRYQYASFESLTDKQIEAFKKTIKELREKETRKEKV